ncbi:class I SAM-dependent methyltransferase [Halothiobacillus sp. DCM-1]|uniref:class I SAM-dependent methyltransferase n=1 Tax=Halothiobacillus sp. DCM-1 TaxID=3112558 RepID=UPI003253DC3D
MPLSQIRTLKSSDFALPLAARWVNHFLGEIKIGRIQVITDDGSSQVFGGESHPELRAQWRLHHPARLFSRIARLGDIGIAEGYIEGDFSTDDLPRLLEIGARNFELLHDDLRAGFWARLVHRVQHLLRANHRRGSRRNIAAHYDLGNAFYALWLDETMTYSAALFRHADEPLAVAQARKYQRLIDALGAQPGEQILEIGCGWGGFAEQAAAQGIHVHGITLSTEQLAFARARVADQSLPGSAQFALTDYRDQTGVFDHIVSIEMFEAVGQRYWPTYFQTVFDRLKPGGRAALQVITIKESAFEHYAREPDFIQRYIFPGGMLPTLTALQQHAQRAGFTVGEPFRFGADYAHTLAHWLARFDAAEPALQAQGFDARFRQTWRYYLAYCIAGFKAGHIDVVQLVLEKPDASAAAPQRPFESLPA